MSDAGYEVDTTMLRYYGLPIRPMIKGTSDNTETQINCSKYEDNYESVDLGLSMKWSTFNLGFDSPERYGDYFAWSAVESYFSSSNNSAKDIEDFSGNATYDAATVNWDSSWRTPTRDECQELIDNCDWEWSTYEQTYVKGYAVTGYNGNSIFLPAAGYCNESYPSNARENGYYWSSTPDTITGSHSYELLFYISDEPEMSNGGYRSYGRSVRPVQD